MKLTVYVVKSQDGKFFRAKGYGGYGSSWVDDINNAKVYTKIGQARRQVSYWSNNFPKFGVPVILEFTSEASNIIDESDRVKKQAEKKLKAKEEAEVRHQKWKLEQAQKELIVAQEKLKKLREGKQNA